MGIYDRVWRDHPRGVPEVDPDTRGCITHTLEHGRKYLQYYMRAAKPRVVTDESGEAAIRDRDACQLYAKRIAKHPSREARIRQPSLIRAPHQHIRDPAIVPGVSLFI